MGARHANHFLHRTPRAELVAAFTPDKKELAWAKENLEPWGVKIYTDYDEMLKHEGLEAVCVATVTTVHAEQTIKAIEAGKHVLCEKPLSTKLDEVSNHSPHCFQGCTAYNRPSAAKFSKPQSVILTLRSCAASLVASTRPI